MAPGWSNLHFATFCTQRSAAVGRVCVTRRCRGSSVCSIEPPKSLPRRDNCRAVPARSTAPTAGAPPHGGIPKSTQLFRGSPRANTGTSMHSIDSRRSDAGRKSVLASSPSVPASRDFKPFLHLPPKGWGGLCIESSQIGVALAGKKYSGVRALKRPFHQWDIFELTYPRDL